MEKKREKNAESSEPIVDSDIEVVIEHSGEHASPEIIKMKRIADEILKNTPNPELAYVSPKLRDLTKEQVEQIIHDSPFTEMLVSESDEVPVRAVYFEDPLSVIKAKDSLRGVSVVTYGWDGPKYSTRTSPAGEDKIVRHRDEIDWLRRIEIHMNYRVITEIITLSSGRSGQAPSISRSVIVNGENQLDVPGHDTFFRQLNVDQDAEIIEKYLETVVKLLPDPNTDN